MLKEINSEIKWTPDLSVGIGDIDTQHRQFISILRELAQNIVKNKKTKIDMIISFLERYAEIHFNLEEVYMTVYSYPDIKYHIDMHDKFRKEIILFREKLNKGKLSIVDVRDKFKNWFFTHIKTVDIKLASFLIKKIKK